MGLDTLSCGIDTSWDTIQIYEIRNDTLENSYLISHWNYDDMSEEDSKVEIPLKDGYQYILNLTTNHFVNDSTEEDSDFVIQTEVDSYQLDAEQQCWKKLPEKYDVDAKTYFNDDTNYRIGDITTHKVKIPEGTTSIDSYDYFTGETDRIFSSNSDVSITEFVAEDSQHYIAKIDNQYYEYQFWSDIWLPTKNRLDLPFTLNSYEYPPAENGVLYDELTIYSTKLEDGETSVVAKFNGLDDADKLNFYYDDKYIYTAFLDKSELPAGKATDENYILNTDTLEWELYHISRDYSGTAKFPVFIGANRYSFLNSADNLKIYGYEYDAELGGLQMKDTSTLLAEYSGDEIARGSISWIMSDFTGYFGNLYWVAEFKDDTSVSEKTVTSFNGAISGKFVGNRLFVTENHLEKKDSDIIRYSDIDSIEDDVISLDDVSNIENNSSKRLVSKSTVSVTGATESEQQVIRTFLNEGTTGTIRLLRINPDSEDNLISSIPYTSDDFRFASYAFEYEDDSYYFLEVETSKDSHEYLYLKWKDENHGWSFSSLVYEPQKAMEILNRPWIYKLSMENVWLNPDIINTIKVYTLNNGIRTEKFHISDKNVIGYGFVFNDFVFHSSMNCQNRVDYECSDGFTYTYLFVGTEPVLISKINTATGTTTRKLPNRNILAGAVNGNRYVVEVPTNARKNDKIVIYGKTIAGVDINYTVTQEHYDDSVVFPVGEYTVINQTTGKKADVVITEDGYTGGEYINLTNPDEISTYSVKSPDGAVLSEGIYQGSLSSFDDIGISGNKLRSKYYAIFETKSGVNNSIYSDDMTISKGYMGVKNDELETVIPKSQLTGDINSDHTVNVADIVKQQKYLFKQENLDLESYVNADMNHDGKVNVIDLALLKKQLLNQS